jgi:NADPH-dependent 2,4-dienoyl-CoA reductase/sulfur reductase-like enzyme
LIVRKAEVFREKQGIHLFTGHGVETIDTQNQKVRGKTLAGENFETSYDKLLIATGASPIMPDSPGFDLPGVKALKSLEDGKRIKEFLTTNRIKKVIIIGMGYIALEMCEALGALNIEVDMVKPGPVFLPWLEPSLARAVKEEIESKNVGIYAGHAVQRIEKSNGNLNVICKDLTLKGDMVLVAIGIMPNSQVAEQAGIELGANDSIAVDRGLKTSDVHIYAAGDCADAYHVVTAEKTWIPLALRANRAGWAVADNVCGKKVELDGVAGTAVFKVFDVEVARTGLNVAEAENSGFEPVEMMITSGSRAHSYGSSSTIRVNMIGDKKSGRLLGAVALHNRMTVDQFSQTDLAYAPPFGPTWDPMLTAANQLLKKL